MSRPSRMAILLVLADAVAVSALAGLVLFLRADHGSEVVAGFTLIIGPYSGTETFLALTLGTAVLAIAGQHLAGGYVRAEWDPAGIRLDATLRGLGYLLAAGFAAHFWFGAGFALGETLPRSTVGYAWIAAAAAILAVRVGWRAAIRMLQRSGRLRDRILIVGGDAAAVMMTERLLVDRARTFDVVGVLSEFRGRGMTIGSLDVLGDPLDLESVSEAYDVTVVIVFASAISWEAQQGIMNIVARRPELTVHFAADYHDLLSAKLGRPRDGLPPLVELRAVTIGFWSYAAKRAMDLGITVAMLPFLGLELLVLRLLAASHRDHRLLRSLDVVGRDGERFQMWLLYTPDRPCLQRSLSRGRMGKLPALLNVLRGEMSVVGPRPVPASMEPPTSVRMAHLQTLKPGLTGPWRFDRTEPSMQSDFLNDLYYVRTQSPLRDAVLILRSARRLIAGGDSVPPYHRERAGETVAAPIDGEEAAVAR